MPQSPTSRRFRPVYIALGSNRDDPPARMRAAVDALRGSRALRQVRASRFIRTSPVGPIAQPDFLTGAGAAEYDWAPTDLLEHLHELETRLGLNRAAKALAETLEMPTESIEAAFHAKAHHGGDLDAEEEFYDTIRSVCETEWRQLLTELNAPFTYVQHQYSDTEFKRVLLTGQGAAAGGVAPFFTQGLQLPAQPLRPTDILNGIGGLAERMEDPSLITAIGLAQFDG